MLPKKNTAKIWFVLSTTVFFSFLFVSISANQKLSRSDNQSGLYDSQPEAVKPVLLPDPGIKNFKFPEPATTVNDWVYNNNIKAMALHGWGLWTAMTMEVGQKDSFDKK